jgi:ADP-ribose pyrophosphatase YjhB (NUDIX family)
VVALVFIRQDDRILLVRQNYGRRHWSLPGGVMERGESVDEAAVREVKEETGLDVRLTRVVGLFPLDELPQPIRGHLRDRVADYCKGQPSAVMRTQ